MENKINEWGNKQNWGLIFSLFVSITTLLITILL